MKVLAELREKRNSLAVEMRSLLDNNKDKWNKELQAKYDEFDNALQDVDHQIKSTQRMMDLDAEAKFGIGEGNPTPKQENKVQALYSKWLRHGDKAITAEEWTAIRNVMSTTTGSEGGFTVQTDVSSTLIDAMKSYSGLRSSGLCEIIRTEKGNELSFATSDGTAEEGEIVAENGAATDEDASFGSISIPVYKFSSKVVTIPIELLQDSSVDVEAMVRNRIAQRLGRITERKFTVGTGTSEPRGLVTAATVGVTAATGNAAAVTYEHLVDLEHSVDPAYRNNTCAFMFNDLTLRYIRKIKDTQGRPIFVPGYETGVPGGAPDTLMGRAIVINQFMADLGANAKSIGFGDLFHYKIRDVMAMELFRFTDSAYTKKGQIGFLAWARHGGNYVDVGGGFKVYQNSAT